MARDARRRTCRPVFGLLQTVAATLAAGVIAVTATSTALAGPTPGSANPAANPAATRVAEPDLSSPPEPSPSPTPDVPPASESPAPESPSPSPSPSTTTTSAPPPVSPPPGRPTTRPPGQPGPQVPGRPRLGVYVTTSDVRLGPTYWSARSTPVELRVDVANTGAAARFALLYSLPDGVTDAGTPGCAPAGGRAYQCTAWTADPGDRWSTRLRLRVSGTAWERMPLMGSVQVSASAPGLGEVRDHQGFAVLFPPGPPTPGIGLVAGEVNFAAADQPATLQVRLRNTGRVTAAGTVEVVLPGGVSVAGPPAGCTPVSARTRCVLGRIPAGGERLVSLPLRATIEAQRAAPLSGAVFGALGAHGSLKRMQMSFLITAVESTATAPPAAAPETSTGPLGGFTPVTATERGLSGVQKTAIALVVVSILLVVLALVLATTSLRRKIEDRPVRAE